jgi:hypothetical protein
MRRTGFGDPDLKSNQCVMYARFRINDPKNLRCTRGEKKSLLQVLHGMADWGYCTDPKLFQKPGGFPGGAMNSSFWV